MNPSPADFNWDGIVDEMDLQWMNFCMGAAVDPNIVKIDTNYDSQIDLPDWGLFAFDYGYSIDPNESSNNDPNCRRSDFDDDGRVGLGDMAILAGHWLDVVTDEYRICSLCNLDKTADPNIPYSENIIDTNDMDWFMADWGKQAATSIGIELLNTDTFETLEPNKPIGGNVFIQLTDMPSIADRMFIQLDNSCLNHYRKDWNPQGTTLLDTSKLSNGNPHLFFMEKP